MNTFMKALLRDLVMGSVTKVLLDLFFECILQVPGDSEYVGTKFFALKKTKRIPYNYVTKRVVYRLLILSCEEPMFNR